MNRKNAQRRLWAGVLLIGGTIAPATAQDVVEPVRLADVLTEAYPIDTTAEAVVLNETGSMALDLTRSSGLVLKRRVRIKILKKSGYRWASVTIPFFNSGGDGREYVKEINGQTYNPSERGGMTVSTLARKNVFEDRQDSKQRALRFTLPDVREGSVIEYSYSLRSDFEYLPDWVFQWPIPVLHSECRLFVLGYNYRMILLSRYPLAEQESKPSRWGGAYRWVLKNLPGFREEPYTAGGQEYQARIQFRPSASTGMGGASWADFDTKLMFHRNFGKLLATSEGVRAEGQKFREAYADTLKRVTAIHEFVKKRIRWDGTYSPFGYPPETTLANGKGDCADQNFLLIALLNSAGVQARPVLLSTRDHGLVHREIPSIAWFNYVAAVARLGGKDVFLDATLPHLPVGMLPPQCLNHTGRLIDGPNSRWIDLAPQQVYGISHALRLKLDADASVSGEASTSSAGTLGLLWRAGLTQDSTLTKTVLNEMYKGFAIGGARVENADSLQKALDVHCTLRSDEGVQQAGDRWYLNPMFSTARKENPFQTPTRSYPVDFGSALEETSLVEITLPPGFGVEELPKPAVFALPDNGGRFTYSVSVDENRLRVTSRMQVRKVRFTPEEYPALRSFFDKIVAKHAEQVVLKKSSVESR